MADLIMITKDGKYINEAYCWHIEKLCPVKFKEGDIYYIQSCDGKCCCSINQNELEFNELLGEK